MFPYNMVMLLLGRSRTFKRKVAITAPLWQRSKWFLYVLEFELRLAPILSMTLSQPVQKTGRFLKLVWEKDSDVSEENVNFLEEE